MMMMSVFCILQLRKILLGIRKLRTRCDFPRHTHFVSHTFDTTMCGDIQTANAPAHTNIVLSITHYRLKSIEIAKFRSETLHSNVTIQKMH